MKTNKNLPSVRRVQHVRRGAALVSVVGTMVVVGVVGASVVSLTSSSTQSHLTANSGPRAHFLAKSGLEFARNAHLSEEWLHGRERTLSLQGGDQVEVIRLADTFWATALVDPGTPKEARASVPMPVNNGLPIDGPGGGGPEVPSISDFVIFGDESFSLKNQMATVGDIGMINEDIEIKGEVDGSVLGHDIEFNAHGQVSVDIVASGFVDIKVGDITGDVHSEEGILLRSSNATVDGWVFSNDTIDLGGGSSVSGHVHATNGNVTLGGNATIGTAADPVEVRASGDVSISGSAKIYGKVYAGGSISGGGGIYGDAYAGGSISGSPTGSSTENSASYLELPIAPDLTRLDGLQLPTPASFNVYGNDVVVQRSSAISVSPDTYCNLYTPRNARGACLYFRTGASGDGNYYFNSVSIGKNMNLFLNLSGTHDIRIFVKNNIEVAKDMNTYVSSDGVTYHLVTSSFADPALAKRVYWESQCNFLIEKNAWFGTVYTPYGTLQAECSSQLIGSFYSGGGHNLKGGTAVYQRSNYLSGN